MKPIAHAKRAHSKIGASSSKRWMNCPGSVALSELVPSSPSSDAADKGTATHELCEKSILTNKDPEYYRGKTFNKKYIADDDMIDSARVYVNYIKGILKKYPGSVLHIEKKFHLRHIHPDLYGSCDALIETPFFKLIVVDFKNGVGVVEVDENSQLMIYGLGGGAISKEEFEVVELVIVQPNAQHDDGPIRSWEIGYDDLIKWGEGLKKYIALTEKKNAPIKAGSWCEYCNARPVCPAMKKLSTEIARTDFDDDLGPALPEIEALNDEQIVRVLEHRKTIEAWFKSVKDYALQKIIAGDHIKGLKLVKGKGSRHWDDEAEVRKRFGTQVMAPPKIVSVSQAEKMLGVKSIKGMWSKYEGSVTVAHENDKRKALSNAKDDFTNVEWEAIDNEE